METEFFNRMRLRPVAFVSRAIRSSNERNLLGRSGGEAFDGVYSFVKVQAVQARLIEAGVAQGSRASSAIGAPTVGSHMRMGVR